MISHIVHPDHNDYNGKWVSICGVDLDQYRAWDAPESPPMIQAWAVGLSYRTDAICEDCLNSDVYAMFVLGDLP